jgi:hypothetical protein
MCKAGFAGDDAPRAVFRKSFHLPARGLKQQETLSYPAAMAFEMTFLTML